MSSPGAHIVPCCDNVSARAMPPQLGMDPVRGHMVRARDLHVASQAEHVVHSQARGMPDLGLALSGHAGGCGWMGERSAGGPAIM